MAILTNLKYDLHVSFLIGVLGFGITVPSAVGGDISIDLAANVVPSRNQLTWQRQEFEALVHFGMNTFTGLEAGTGFELPETFSPTEINCDQWAEAARIAGAKSIIFTAKHHDGFCLWPSRFTEHSIRHSPWKSGKGDVVREIAEACRKAGLGFGIYLSPADLHHPDYGRNTRRYNEYFTNQLRELLTDYGPIIQVFFDGAEPSARQQRFDWPGYHRLIRELQPDAVISIRGPDVRWVGNEAGVGRLSEWSPIPFPKVTDEYDWPDLTAPDLGSRERWGGSHHLQWYPAVATVSLSRGWFWHPGPDRAIKSLPELFRIYEQTVGRNCGLQLNIMPDRTGRVPELDFNRLREFGDGIRGRFATNFCASSNAEVTNLPATTEVPMTKSVIFREPIAIRYVMLQEDITQGQHVEEADVVLVSSDGSQRTFPVTTIGWKRILKVEVKQARQILVKVKKSRGEPFVSVAAY